MWVWGSFPIPLIVLFVFHFGYCRRPITNLDFKFQNQKIKLKNMGDQQFFLKWNDFQNNMVTSFKHLRDEKSFTDVSYIDFSWIYCFNHRILFVSIGHSSLWRTDLQGTQDGALCVQSILQNTTRRESLQASNHHSQGCFLQSSTGYSRIHVSTFPIFYCFIDFIAS